MFLQIIHKRNNKKNEITSNAENMDINPWITLNKNNRSSIHSRGKQLRHYVLLRKLVVT